MVENVTWYPDAGSSEGKQFQRLKKPISNVNDPTVYQSERYNEGNLTYNFQVGQFSAPSYRVRLHFAEIFFREPPGRIFDIDVNRQVIADFDILSEGKFAAF